MKTDCSTDSYAELYAPWLENADDFALKFVRPEDRVLDLCGGTGRVMTKAWDMGCQSVALLDANPRAVAFAGLKQVKGDANHPDHYFPPGSFDVVLCRQAIAYLNLESVALGVAQVLAPGGRFCFNNFRKPRWFWKRYEYRNSRYSELGWHIGRDVWHIQRRKGHGWDLTRFKWHQHGDIMSTMSRRFDVFHEQTKKTNYYTCVLRGE